MKKNRTLKVIMAASTSYTDQIPLTFRHKKFRSHRHYPKNVVDNNRSMDIPVDLKLDEDKTEHAKEIWRSRGLTPWSDYMGMFLERKVNLVTSEDVKNVFKPKKKKVVEDPQNLEEILQQSKKSNNNIVISPMSPKDQAVITPDSGQGKEDSSVNIEDSIEESVVKEEEFTDLELLASDEDDDDSKDQHKIDEISNNKKSSTLAGGQPDCEDISSDEEEWD